jgi:hypothetical protein
VPRATIDFDGRVTHMDDALGDDFALVSIGPAADGDPSPIQIRHLGEVEMTHTVADREGTMRAWFAELGAQAVLVRPDRVVMASGRAAAAPGWLDSLTRACGWKARPSREDESLARRIP